MRNVLPLLGCDICKPMGATLYVLRRDVVDLSLSVKFSRISCLGKLGTL